MQNKLNTILALSVAGTLFAGYLSSGKFFSDTCILDTSCSYFFGYPTCYYGFVMYVAMLLFTLLALMTLKYQKHALLGVFGVSIAGILFSGYYSIIEILPMFKTGIVYALGLPTCAYGLVVYVAIAVLAYKMLNNEVPPPEAGGGTTSFTHQT